MAYGDPSQMYDPEQLRQQYLNQMQPGSVMTAPVNQQVPTSSPNTGVTGGTAPQTSPVATAFPTFNYEQARDSWMSGQYGTGASGAQAWASANGVPYSGGDTITLPNGGGSIDIIGNYAGGAGNGQTMTNNWTPAGGNGAAPGGSTIMSPTSPLGGGGASLSGTAGSPAAGTGPLNPVVADYGRRNGLDATQTRSLNDFISAHPGMTIEQALQQWVSGGDPTQEALRKSLLEQMNTAGKPFDPNSAAFQGQWNPIRNTLERNALSEKSAAAERAAFQGSSVGGAGGPLNSEMNSIQENLGNQEANAQGQLIGQEVAAQRQQLQQALQLANSLGARDQATQLQQQLAELDQKYKYAALGQQESQFGRNLAQQGSQWNDQYGLSRQQLEMLANLNAYNAALGR